MIRAESLLTIYRHSGYWRGTHRAGQSIRALSPLLKDFGRGHTGVLNGNCTIPPARHNLWRE